MRTKAVVSLSGGMDSVTALAEALATEREVVLAVSFTYGSKHNVYENDAAKLVAEHYDVPWCLVDLTKVMEGFPSALMKSGGEIPEGHYQQANMDQTVVPGRNLIFASILTGHAWALEAKEVWLGIHSGDHVIYPDCRPSFFMAMDSAIAHGTDGRVHLVAPFLKGDKTSIIARGLELHVPYELTRTCYKNQRIACGKCGSCQERLEAFANNGIDDPLQYESRELLAKV